MDVMSGSKGKPLFVVDGYTFRHQKVLKDGHQRWSCTKADCKCFLKLDPSNVIVYKSVQHNHDKLDEKTLNRRRLSNRLKMKAVDDKSIKPSILIRKELWQSDVKTLTTTDVSYIKRNIRRSRSNAIASSPTTKPQEESEEDTERVLETEHHIREKLMKYKEISVMFLPTAK